MALVFAAANEDLIEVAEGYSFSLPITLACWYYLSSTVAACCPLCVYDDSGDNYCKITMSPANYKNMAVSGDDDTSVYVASTNTTALNTWCYGVSVFTSSTSRTAYLNGSGANTNTDEFIPSGLDSISVGGNGFSGLNNQWLTGGVCEAAVWDTALTAADAAILGNGFSPLLVKSANLVFYAPLVRYGDGHYIDRIGGKTLVEIADPPASVTAHPRRISYPYRPRIDEIAYKIYSIGQYQSLPSGTTDLTTAYSEQNYSDVATANDTRVTSSGQDLNYVLHQFKNFVGSEENCTLNWEGQSSTAPKDSTVYLQIYKVNGSTWETVASNSVEEADTDFQLYAEIASLTDYVSGGYITCRVYQRDI